MLVRVSARLLKKTLTHTDERAKVEGELLDGMDVVKCMTWEVTQHCMSNCCENCYDNEHTDMSMSVPRLQESYLMEWT